jgi:hypothetical protein
MRFIIYAHLFFLTSSAMAFDANMAKVCRDSIKTSLVREKQDYDFQFNVIAYHLHKSKDVRIGGENWDQVYNYNSETFSHLEKSIEIFLSLAAKFGVQYTYQGIQNTKNTLNYYFKPWDNDLSNNISPFLSMDFCDPNSIVGCYSALWSTFQELNVIFASPYLALPNVYERVLTNPKYAGGAALTAVKLMKRIRAIEAGAKPGHENVLLDFTDSFTELGFSPTEATDMAFDLLALYSTRGDTLDRVWFLTSYENRHVISAMVLISSAMSYLDQLYAREGQLYSYPPNIKSSCAYDRPYHFWMGAYLSRFLRSKGYSRRLSSLAPYLVATTYQVQPGLKAPAYALVAESPYRDSTRISLTFDAAGAVYGADTLVKNLDLDQAYFEMVRVAKPIPNLPNWVKGNLVTLYPFWARVIAPKSAFEYLYRQ